jgi:hypothetical protein
MLDSGWFIGTAAGALLAPAIVVPRSPKLRRHIPLMDHARFFVLYLTGKHGGYSFGELYDGFLGRGNQDRGRARSARGSETRFPAFS